MMKDLPKNVPAAVLAAAQGALKETADMAESRRKALDAYRGEAFRAYAEECRAHVMYDELPAKAQALLDWGAMVQARLPLAELSRRFWVSGAPHAPCLPVAAVEVALTERVGFEGKLTSELLLVLDPEEGVFRHEDRLNGFLVNGVGLLNTQAAIFHSIHPVILARLHDYVATESHVWWYVERGLSRMVRASKDR